MCYRGNPALSGIPPTEHILALFFFCWSCSEQLHAKNEEAALAQEEALKDESISIPGVLEVFRPAEVCYIPFLIACACLNTLLRSHFRLSGLYY